MKKLVLALAMVTGLSFSSKANDIIQGTLMRICRPGELAVCKCVGSTGRCCGIHTVSDTQDYFVITLYGDGNPDVIVDTVKCSEIDYSTDSDGNLTFTYVEIP